MRKPFKGIINLDVRDSIMDWDPYRAEEAPEGSPNVLVVLYDDTGLAAWSPYGGRINMPTMDRLAANGPTASGTRPRCARRRAIMAGDELRPWDTLNADEKGAVQPDGRGLRGLQRVHGRAGRPDRRTSRCSTTSARPRPTTTIRRAGRRAFSTPFKMFKRYTYQGGVCDPRAPP